jgi:hypothetical protein
MTAFFNLYEAAHFAKQIVDPNILVIAPKDRVSGPLDIHYLTDKLDSGSTTAESYNYYLKHFQENTLTPEIF